MMQINSQTKIAALLRQNPDALEAIVTLSPDFKKLRNPILRKLMAGRTSIAMASKIGGCKPQDFFNILEPLGFEADSSPTEEEVSLAEQTGILRFLKNIELSKIITLDVRAMLAGGSDPLRLIQQKVKEMQPGQVLKIINTFEPVPLIKLLQKQSFIAYVDIVEQQLVETYFYKSKEGKNQAEEDLQDHAGDWEKLLSQYQNRLEEIDVRHLEMPMPMMTILKALEDLPENRALFVHHKRVPIYLLTELKDRNFDYRIRNVKEGEVYLLIFRS
jgi:TusA-related sulfurtransferase